MEQWKQSDAIPMTAEDEPAVISSGDRTSFFKFCPEALESFQRLVDTGRVELLAETYYHSLAFLYSRQEFIEQVALHEKKIKKLYL
ncbi:MAG: hypothetical protein IIB08_05520 [Bacteroidetes bacterium]|nr:hypothetical protein [Bacteroidota bacterium]